MEKDLLYDSVGRSLSKRFQSQKPCNIFKQSITLLTLFISLQAVVKRTGVFLPPPFTERRHCSQAFAHTQTQRLCEGVTRNDIVIVNVPRHCELT